MCVVSMVFDHYEPRFPRPYDSGTGGGLGDWLQQWQGLNREPTVTPSLANEIVEMRKLITEFRQAVEAAKRVDELTDQPDCLDPNKAALEDRVAEIERRLNEARF
jgi:hypothetical protein